MIGVGVACIFIWLGMVIGISFIETPLKFRAPGMTRALGLGIGRIVFRVMNLGEITLAIVITIAMIADLPGGAAWTFLVLGWCVLIAQTAMRRFMLDPRARRIIAGETVPPSRQHVVFLSLEVAKVALLIALGTTLLRVLSS